MALKTSLNLAGSSGLLSFVTRTVDGLLAGVTGGVMNVVTPSAGGSPSESGSTGLPSGIAKTVDSLLGGVVVGSSGGASTAGSGSELSALIGTGALDGLIGLKILDGNSVASLSLTYGPQLSNADDVEQLYENVLRRDGEAGGIRSYVDKLDGGAVSRADVLIGFSESPENVALVGARIDQGFFLS